MAVRMSMNWVRGNAYSITVTIRNESNVLVSVVGWTLDFVVRAAQLGTILLALDNSDGISIPGGADVGEVVITVSAARTEALAAGEYVYALRRTNAGNEDTVTLGKLTVEHSAAIPAP